MNSRTRTTLRTALGRIVAALLVSGMMTSSASAEAASQLEAAESMNRLAATLAGEAAQGGTLYFEVAVADLVPPPTHRAGLLFHHIGPFGLNANVLGAVDVGGASARPEVLLATDNTIVWFDLDTETLGELDSTPDTVDSMAAIDFTGSDREDLVVAIAGKLLVFDFDAPSSSWQGPFVPPIAATSLAVANVVGGLELDLVVSDGSTLSALDDGRGSDWQGLSAPPVMHDLIAAIDIGEEAGLSTATVSHRSLAIFNDDDIYLYEVGEEAAGDSRASWSAPTKRRFRTRSSAPLNLNFPDGPALGSVVLLESLTESPVRMQNIAATAGLMESAYGPAGDVHCPGAVLTDIDGDELLDVYLARGLGSQEGTANTLLLGDGQAHFTASDQARGASNSAGAIVFDYDNDGDPDLYVINFDQANVLYENQNGSFTDVTAATDPTPGDPPGDMQEGLAYGMYASPCEPDESPPCQLDDSLAAGVGDIDRDGFLDVYVGNHLRLGFTTTTTGERDVLYRNNGDGTFTDITDSSGITASQPPGQEGSSQALLIVDLNNDLWPDIYVTRKDDGPTRDQLFLNDGDVHGDGWDGTFTEYFGTAPSPLGEVTEAAMGIAAGDYDRDGDLDLYLTDIGDMDLYRNRMVEDGSFSLEVIAPGPVAAPYLSWGAAWLDLDNDGNLDLHVASDTQQMDHFFQGDGAGGLVEVTIAAHLGRAHDSRGLAPGDIDRDGRIDLLEITKDVGVVLHRNQSNTDNHWLSISLEGDPRFAGPYRSSRDALGARVEVETTDGTQRKDLLGGGGMCSSAHDFALNFGIGTASVANVRVMWPGGTVTVLQGVAADQRLLIRESLIFEDGFESGVLCAWDQACP